MLAGGQKAESHKVGERQESFGRLVGQQLLSGSQCSEEDGKTKNAP